jgi:hypothetical protein
MAQMVFDHGLTCVLDVSRFASKAAQARFLTDFATTIFWLHQESPRPLHLILEEAEEYLPQNVTRDDGMTQCVGAWTKLIKLGGAFGLGLTLVTQRSASLNKNALTQIETLFVLRTPAELDQKAIKGWLGAKTDQDDILPTLSSLANGEAWVVSPHFLGSTTRVQMNRRSTFDSGETPKVGRRKAPPATLADIDLGSIAAQMATSIEAAEANDPTALKRRVKALQAQLDQALAAAESAEGPERIVEVPVEVIRVVEVCPPDLFDALEALARVVPEIGTQLVDAHRSVEEAAAQARAADGTKVLTSSVPAPAKPALDLSRPRGPARAQAPARPVAARRPAPASPAAPGADLLVADGFVLDTAMRALLTVLAQHPEGLNRKKLGFLSGYNPTKSTIRTALGALRRVSYITPGGVDTIRILDAGLDALGDFDPLPSGPELLAFWHSELDTAQSALLAAFIDAYPADVDKADIFDLTGYSPAKSTYRTAMGVLRRVDLVDGMRANDDFMEAIS